MKCHLIGNTVQGVNYLKKKSDKTKNKIKQQQQNHNYCTSVPMHGKKKWLNITPGKDEESAAYYIP